MIKRICSLSLAISLSAAFLYANENTAAAGTLTTCNNGITISFMVSTIATQLFLAILIGRILAKVNALGEGSEKINERRKNDNADNVRSIINILHHNFGTSLGALNDLITDYLINVPVKKKTDGQKEAE